MQLETLKSKLDATEKNIKEVELAFYQLQGQRAMLAQLIKEEENAQTKGTPS